MFLSYSDARDMYVAMIAVDIAIDAVIDGCSPYSDAIVIDAVMNEHAFIVDVMVVAVAH